jgi:hypothetical protein
MKLLKSDYIGLGFGYNYKFNEISIHLFIWNLDIKFKK